MKCLCGYANLEDWEIDRESNLGLNKELAAKLRRDNGIESFIKIDGIFTRESSNGNISKVRIYACPKCGTVRAEIY